MGLPLSIGIFFDGAEVPLFQDFSTGTVMSNLARRYQAAHGNSTFPNVFHYRFPAWPNPYEENIADAKAKVKALRDLYTYFGCDPNLLRVDIFGYSRGGAAAIALANQLGSKGYYGNLTPIPVRFLGVLDAVPYLNWAGQSALSTIVDIVEEISGLAAFC